ncbi:MAG: DNA alkylation repair protein, partial [Desulfobacterales bacterium]|nr:DNA alkylation repair protein [Desulfobacterales bacterium]
MKRLKEIQRRLREMGDEEKAAVLQRFFKTGPGEYGEGDIFLGIRVPELRKLSREFKDADLTILEALL